MIPMNRELYTSFVISASAMAITGGTRDQKVCCTESALVTKAMATMSRITMNIATTEIEIFESFFCIFPLQ